MEELKGIIKGSYVIGEKIIQAAKYQVLFIVYVLRGGIILGFFPSLAAVFYGLYQQIRKKELITRQTFSRYYKETFKISNQLGFTALASLIFLWLDLRISATYIHLPIIHFFLLILFVLVFGASIFIFPALCRYELTYKQYIQRVGILFFCNFIETIAIILGIYLATIVLTLFPMLLVFAAVPIFSLPLVWFGIQAMNKAEQKAATL
ncbi:hypothetical protein IGI37_001320 [Enterococcus sp. AZ194]|uniref:YesL family protein n=1 Tax=Enterococcus sp. AZ194 TaxID=2774629 RepID=UPI003F24074D